MTRERSQGGGRRRSVRPSPVTAGGVQRLSIFQFEDDLTV